LRKLRLPLFWILDDEHRPVAVRDVLEWGEFFNKDDKRRVALTEFEPGVRVSTVFLGLDHRYFGKGPPLLFETMVFGLNLEDEAFTTRYATWDDAETGHKAIVRKVQEQLAEAARVTIPQTATKKEE
jgi:hypothetical protein